MRSYGPLPQPLKPCAGGPNSAFCLGGRVKCQKDRFGAGGNRGRVEAAEGHVRANAILRDCIAMIPSPIDVLLRYRAIRHVTKSWPVQLSAPRDNCIV
jgi:hypothetical protein